MDLTFEEFWEDLNNGFEYTFYYLDNKYLISKMNRNCYLQKLIEMNVKSPQPKNSVITTKRLKEIFPYIKDIEYVQDTLN